MTLRLTMLPARQGDALWLEWGRRPWRLLVDFGMPATGRMLRERILALDPADRKFELLVVTHVDEDHIGGALTAFVEGDQIDGLEFGDAWFNGWEHLNETPPGFESASAAQGEQFTQWVRQSCWNKRFGGKSVEWRDGQKPLIFADGLTITILGPPRRRLDGMKETWQKAVDDARRRQRRREPDEPVPEGYVAAGARSPPTRPTLDCLAELEALADRRAPLDDTEANGTSIALLLEYKGRRVLLGADAFAEDLIGAIQALRAAGHSEFDTDGRLRLDAFKLPHHGSMGNVTRELVDAVACSDWLVSTDGTRFFHPDATAIARIIKYSVTRPCRLHFNVRGNYNEWWQDASWRRRFGYQTTYGDSEAGLTWLSTP